MAISGDVASTLYIIFGQENWTTGNVDQDAGLFAEYFFLNGFPSVSDFPDFDDLEPDLERVDSQINFPVTSGTFPGIPDSNVFAVRWTGQIRIDSPGLTQFFLGSDDGSRLFIDNQLVIDNGGLHPFIEASGSIDLEAGFHDIRVEMFENFGAAAAVLSWDPADTTSKQLVPEDVLFRDSRDVLNVVTDHDVEIDGFSGPLTAVSAGDVTPLIGNGIVADLFDLAGTESNQAVSLDGIDDVITIPSTDALSNPATLTLELRFRVNEFTNTFMPLIQKSNGTTAGRSYAIYVESDGKIRLETTNDGGGLTSVLTDPDEVVEGQWYEFAAVMDRTNNTIALYLNGEEVGSNEIDDVPAFIHDSPLLLGASPESFSAFSNFAGDIEEFVVWTTARTVEEIDTDFGGFIDPETPDLAGYWRFDELSGLNVDDISPSENTGTLGDGVNPDTEPARLALLRNVPDFDSLTPVASFVDNNIDYFFVPENFADIDELDQLFGARWMGDINVTSGGEITFVFANTDRARLFIDDILVVDHWSLGVGDLSEFETINLTPGIHSIRVEFLANDPSHAIALAWDPTGGTGVELLNDETFVIVDETADDPTALGFSDIVVSDGSQIKLFMVARTRRGLISTPLSCHRYLAVPASLLGLVMLILTVALTSVSCRPERCSYTRVVRSLIHWKFSAQSRAFPMVNWFPPVTSTATAYSISSYRTATQAW